MITQPKLSRRVSPPSEKATTEQLTWEGALNAQSSLMKFVEKLKHAEGKQIVVANSCWFLTSDTRKPVVSGDSYTHIAVVVSHFIKCSIRILCIKTNGTCAYFIDMLESFQDFSTYFVLRREVCQLVKGVQSNWCMYFTWVSDFRVFVLQILKVVWNSDINNPLDRSLDLTKFFI